MSHLGSVSWSDLATKADIEGLAAATRHDIEGLAAATRREIEFVRQEVIATFTVELAKVRVEAANQASTLRSEIVNQTRTMIFALVSVVVAVASLVLAAA